MNINLIRHSDTRPLLQTFTFVHFIAESNSKLSNHFCDRIKIKYKGKSNEKHLTNRSRDFYLNSNERRFKAEMLNK